MTENNKIYDGKYVKGNKASKLLGIHQRTLYQWEEKGIIETIRTPGGHRLYNVEKFLKKLIIEENDENYNEIDKMEGKLNLCYVRVSTNNQKDDLERQKEMMKKKYPNHKIIEDIGSGLNLNKRGIRKIITLAIEGKINELVIAYRDRLTRFGYELLEELVIKYSQGRIKVINEKDKIEPETELVQDVMAILNVYTAKMNGLRRYRKKVNKEEKP